MIKKARYPFDQKHLYEKLNEVIDEVNALRKLTGYSEDYAKQDQSQACEGAAKYSPDFLDDTANESYKAICKAERARLTEQVKAMKWNFEPYDDRIGEARAQGREEVIADVLKFLESSD